MVSGPSLIPAIAFTYCASLAVAAATAEPSRLALASCLAPVLIWLSGTDLRRAEIPDGAVAIIALAGLGFQGHRLGAGPPLVMEIAVAALMTGLLWIGGGLYFRRTGQEAIGIGDAKLIGAGTLAAGAASLWAMILVAAIGGITAGLLTRRHVAPDAVPGIPFGPFLAYSILIFTLFPLEGPVFP